MSALGMGIFFGCFIALVSVVPKAFDDQRPALAALGALALFGIILAPPLTGSFLLDLLIGAAAVPFGLYLIRRQHIGSIARQTEETHQAAHAAAAAQEAQRCEQRAKVEIARQEWLTVQKDWGRVSPATILNVESHKKCFAFLSVDETRVRFVGYDDKTAFTPNSEITFDIDQIISMEVLRTRQAGTRYRDEPYAVMTKENRSPVARGLIGGALLGPAGVVMGAASGLAGKTETKIEHRSVAEQYEVVHEPRLVIGTSVSEFPLLNVRFTPSTLAEEWMYRVRGAQARRKVS